MDLKTIAGLAVRHALTVGAGALATHGIITGGQTETLVSAGMAVAGVAWSIWDKFGRAAVLAELDVLRARIEAHTRDRQARAAEIRKPPAALVLFAFVLPAIAALLLAAPAMAASKLLPEQVAQTKLAAGRGANDGGPAVSSTDSDADPKRQAGLVGKLLAKPFQDFAELLNGDMDGAIALSTAIPDLQDGNGQACWTALRSAGAVFREHPVPLTMRLATDIQGFRLLVMAANRLCTNSACTQVFQDGKNIALAVSPVPLLVPSLADLCAKIPAIAIAPPATGK